MRHRALSVGIAVVIALAVVASTGLVLAKKTEKAMSPHNNEILKELLAGNKRYVEGRMAHPHQTASWRRELATAQHPEVAIVGCSDSRVPPELVFDQGLGDLFVVRVAGNVLNDENLGTLEYGVDHVGVSLIVVLGHQRCGALTAAMKGGEFPPHVARIMETLKPACEEAKAHPEGDLVEEAARINVRRAVEQIKHAEPILAKFVREGKLAVVGAYYDLDSGKVEMLGE